MASPMYDFFRIQYQLGKITEAKLENTVTKGFITADEKTTILTAGPSP